jgi:hypothetical protein
MLWRFIVNDGPEIRNFVRDVPDGIMKRFDAIRDGKIDYLRRALSDGRIRGHAMTICEPECQSIDENRTLH